MIAVILMVAITVVLAAVVYVWVSQFGAPGAQPGTMTIQSQGPEGAGNVRSLMVTSVSPGMTYGDLRLILDGAALEHSAAAPADGEWGARRGAAWLEASAAVEAGDTIRVDATGPTKGQTLTISQPSAGTVITTLRLN